MMRASGAGCVRSFVYVYDNVREGEQLEGAELETEMSGDEADVPRRVQTVATLVLAESARVYGVALSGEGEGGS